jgi:hypothetical protein
MTENDYREAIITHSQALYQLEKHGVIDLEEFHHDLGERETYTGEEILNWLGY